MPGPEEQALVGCWVLEGVVVLGSGVVEARPREESARLRRSAKTKIFQHQQNKRLTGTDRVHTKVQDFLVKFGKLLPTIFVSTL